MKLLWQNKFEGFDMTRTSPLYYRCAAERDNRVLNCRFFDNGLGITDASFCIQTGQILTWSSTGNTKEYREKYEAKHAPYHLECDDFIFGDYTISHYGQQGYLCRKNGSLLWKKSLKGYLYTDITLVQNNLVFGTSGQGGHFYSLNMDTGEIVFDFNTGGTSVFYNVNNRFYFCSSDRKNTQVFAIDDSGNVLEKIEMEGAYRDGCSLLKLCDDFLCVITLKKKRKENTELYSPIFNCIQI